MIFYDALPRSCVASFAPTPVKCYTPCYMAQSTICKFHLIKRLHVRSQEALGSARTGSR